jgi:predicted nucleic acid-binding protein
MTTSKILDNTVISAFINEIRSVEMIEICRKEYLLVTTDCVQRETSERFSGKTIAINYKNINVFSKTGDKKYDQALDYLTNRYPYLHEGELSAFLLALIDYELTGNPYFFITDDRKMREKICEIISSDIFLKIIGVAIYDYHFSGTIGLIKRLCQKGCLSENEINMIVFDIKNSTFRISDKLIGELIGCSK